MSKPATEMRLARAAEGFTEVIGRGNAHIITKHPVTKKCCYDGQIGGGWHYGTGLETDTAWLPGTAPWNWQMVKAGYNVFALSNFKDGQVLKWVDPGSGQYVTFQPMALQWTDALNQIQQISMPRSVAAQANDDILYWPAAYGAGRNFRYQASPLRLNKQLIIDTASALPSTSYDTLELNFIIAVSSGVNIMADVGDGQGSRSWDKKTRKDTAKAISFQLPGGAVLWSFAAPRAWDSAGNETTGSMRLKKSGSSLYVSVRFSKSWIDSILPANYPIVFDPTVDYQVAANGNDAYFGTTWAPTMGFWATSSELKMGTQATNYIWFHGMFRWPTVTIPVGATVDTSYITLYYKSKNGTPQPCVLSFNDADNPNAPTTYTQANGLTLTTNNISFTPASSGTWFNSGDISNILNELISSFNYSSGAAMICVVRTDPAGSAGWGAVYDYIDVADYAAKLHIEYTEAAASGNPFYAYAQQ